ncbi:hypothetical protein P9X10_02580 [Bacillus cereus]|nr:hypothetical protein [Bacillus cereus]
MKQPKINIQGKIYKVLELGFNSKTGELDKVLFQYNSHENGRIFKSHQVETASLTGYEPITETVRHPYHNHYLTPDLISLIIFEEETLDKDMLNQLHDCVYGALGVVPLSSKLQTLVKDIPDEIITLGEKFGWNDTEVREKLFLWSQENLDLIKKVTISK